MTHVLLFATQATADGSTTALLPRDSATVIESLIGTMRSLDVEAITVITRPAWAGALRDRGIAVIESADVAGDLAVVAAVSTNGSVVLAAADLVAHRAALEKLAGVRVTKTDAAVTMTAVGDVTAQPIMRQRDQVISVETHAHDVTGPNAFFRGMVAVGPSDREHLVAACLALTDYAADDGVDLDVVAGDFGAPGLVLLALVRADVPVSAYSVRYLHMTRVTGDAEAKAASDRVASTNEENASLQASKKEDEEFLATYLVQSYTPYWVRFFARHGISPNMVTWSSVVVAAGATAAFITTSRALWVLGAVLLYLSFILDCCDGGVARVTGKSSRYGGWFDMISDRIKEYGIYAGLAIGGVRAGYSGMWALALTAMVLMTVRHMVDTWYNALQATATRSLPAVPLASRADRLAIRANAAVTSGGAARIGTALGQLSATAHGHYRSPAYWLKRSVVLPIGDRWLIIAITAAIWGPQVSFIVLLCCIVLAFAYIFSGRTLRALSMRISVLPKFDIALQRDDGLVALLLGRRLPPLPITFPAIIAAVVALAFDIADHPPHDGDGRMWLAVGLGVIALGSVLGARAAHDGSLDWLVPAALRAVEYTFILVAGLYNGVPQPLIYGLIAAITLVHYEISSRTEKAATPMGNLRAALGWDGRIVVIAVTTAIGLATAGFAALTILVGAVLVIEMVAGLARRRPA